MRKSLPPDVERALAPRPPSNPALTTCPVCKQKYDMNQLADAYYHNNEPHPPHARSATTGG